MIRTGLRTGSRTGLRLGIPSTESYERTDGLTDGHPRYLPPEN
jgi:hypothetical protein